MVRSAPPPITVPHPLPDRLAELVAGRFRVLCEPMRIKLLDHLRDGPATVTELQAAIGASQQNVSKHLGVLLSAGMVSRTKQGNFSRYEIADSAVFELCDLVCGRLREQVGELEQLLETGEQRLRTPGDRRGRPPATAEHRD